MVSGWKQRDKKRGKVWVRVYVRDIESVGKRKGHVRERRELAQVA